jgi:hypothetical protein
MPTARLPSNNNLVAATLHLSTSRRSWRIGSMNARGALQRRPLYVVDCTKLTPSWLPPLTSEM